MDHEVVSQESWFKAQKEFSHREEELTKKIAELSAQRRKLPWLKVTKNYTFDGPEGKQTLSDLFQGRRQLVMQHFMFSPEWKEGCPGCSVQADTVDGARYHFEPKGVSFVAVSRAPLEKIQAFRERMGWRFNWVSSENSDFNFDFNVSFTPEEMAKNEAFYNYEKRKVSVADLPALSVFIKDESGDIYRTYTNYAVGDDLLLVYQYLDLTPIGRNEKSYFDWIKHHDKYEGAQP
jgi:predicted dithiol-disulfide oxidoreductase (DUF899 family)